MQYLYGSGEAAALSLQAYQALWNYLKVEIGYRRDKAQVRSVVLAPGSTLDNPRFDTCGKRPMAVVLDVDETALLNLGYERDEAARGGGYDAARWSRWEQSGADKVAAVPGAAEALAAARREGFTVIFNSNRSVERGANRRRARSCRPWPGRPVRYPVAARRGRAERQGRAPPEDRPALLHRGDGR
jgi:predicted secreted acid phosphatase